MSFHCIDPTARPPRRPAAILRIPALCRATLSLWLGALAVAAAQDIARTQPAAILHDPRINESSGLAIGIRNPSVFWTLNDSGGGPYLFAFNGKGKTVARFEIARAFNFDWEDVACGPDSTGKPALFLGDIGDNFACRPEVTIYQVEEPAVDADAATPAERKLEGARALRAIYPDGRHNAESLLSHPKSGRLFIITKRDDGRCGVYAFPEKLAPEGCMILEKTAEFRLDRVARPGKRPVDNCMATGACFSPDASRLVVSTYSSLYEWTIGPGQNLAEALVSPPLRIIPPLTAQMEAVCYDPNGAALWFTSEKLPAPLYRVAVNR